MSRTSFEPDFRVSVAGHEAAEPVIRVRGELDSGTCEELLDTFRSVLGAGTAREVTLDLSEVSFIDSAGTRAVIMLEREARDQGASVVVTAPPVEVTELLRTAGVIEHLQLRPDAMGAAAESASALERVELELPLDSQSPARARAELRELMTDRDRIQTGDVVLMASEIVTNAVVHPGAPPGTRIGLCICIRDLEAATE